MELKKIDWWLLGQTVVAAGTGLLLWKPIRLLARPDDWHTDTPLAESALPPVSIIVPARNEAANIERCVVSLLAQDYPHFEVIAVDDGSQDATPQILEGLTTSANGKRLQVLHLNALPPGWAGKPHAMQMGSQAAATETQWLLFTDADTVHQPQALRRAVTKALTEGCDLFSILPTMELKSFWERVLMPLAMLGISLQYPAEKVNSPASKLAIANGQFLLLRRAAYERVGGYGGKLKASLLDDRDMALAIKASGGRICLCNGRELMAVRMYQNLGEIWRGWRKNAFVGSRSAYLSVPFFVLAMLAGGVLPLLQLVYALLKLLRAKDKNRARWQLWAGLSGLQLGLQAITQYRIMGALGVPQRYSFTSPLAALMFSGILSDSMWRSITGRGVNWKGRSYAQAARTQQLIK